MNEGAGTPHWQMLSPHGIEGSNLFNTPTLRPPLGLCHLNPSCGTGWASRATDSMCEGKKECKASKVGIVLFFISFLYKQRWKQQRCCHFSIVCTRGSGVARINSLSEASLLSSTVIQKMQDTYSLEFTEDFEARVALCSCQMKHSPLFSPLLFQVAFFMLRHALKRSGLVSFLKKIFSYRFKQTPDQTRLRTNQDQ